MSKIEILMLSAIICIPLLSIVLAIPKKKKNKATKEKPKTVLLNEAGQSEDTGKKVEQVVVKPTIDQTIKQSLQDEDFKEYLKEKVDKISKPQMKNPHFDDDILKELEADIKKDVHKKRDGVRFSNEWENLSTEMKVFVISNIFEKKF